MSWIQHNDFREEQRSEGIFNDLVHQTPEQVLVLSESLLYFLKAPYKVIGYQYFSMSLYFSEINTMLHSLPC